MNLDDHFGLIYLVLEAEELNIILGLLLRLLIDKIANLFENSVPTERTSKSKTTQIEFFGFQLPTKAIWWEID